MTPEQQSKAQQALQGKIGACPICQTSEWNLVDITTGMIFQSGAFVVGGPTIPMLVIACRNCYFLAHFSAVALGLVPREGSKT